MYIELDVSHYLVFKFGTSLKSLTTEEQNAALRILVKELNNDDAGCLADIKYYEKLGKLFNDLKEAGGKFNLDANTFAEFCIAAQPRGAPLGSILKEQVKC